MKYGPSSKNTSNLGHWYVLMMMIGSGYEHSNKEFTHTYCYKFFELYLNRALGEMKMPSPEEMQMIKYSYIRLMPREGAYEEFFSKSSTKERILR